MGRFLIGIVLFTGCFAVKAQQDPVFGQFMFNQSYWLPALTAYDGLPVVTLFSRSQWVGYETSFDQQGGAPATQFLNFSTPLSLFNIPVGLGSNVIYDRIGPQTSIHVQFMAAYSLELPRGAVRFGIRPSINNRILDFNRLKVNDGTDPLFSAGQQDSQFALDLDASVAFASEDFIVGATIGHLLRPSYEYGLGENAGDAGAVDMIYSLYGEYNYFISGKLKLSPSLLAQSDINAFTFNVGFVATYDEKMWAGLSYRYQESLVFLLGYSFLTNQSLKFGYSFDYVVHEQEAKSPTSHEFFVRFNLPTISVDSKKIIRTPRFRF